MLDLGIMRAEMGYMLIVLRNSFFLLPSTSQSSCSCKERDALLQTVYFTLLLFSTRVVHQLWSSFVFLRWNSPCTKRMILILSICFLFCFVFLVKPKVIGHLIVSALFPLEQGFVSWKKLSLAYSITDVSHTPTPLFFITGICKANPSLCFSSVLRESYCRLRSAPQNVR